MEFENSRFGKCEIADITQGRLEKFQEALKGETELPLAVLYGKMVTAAVGAGILLHPALDAAAVSNANPGFIKWLARVVSEQIAEAQRIDPLS